MGHCTGTGFYNGRSPHRRLEAVRAKDVTIDAPVTRSSDGLRTLWKRRRRGGSGSDSDSDSDSSSGGYGYDDSSSSGGGGGDSDGYNTCFVAENVTRKAHSDGYLHFYSRNKPRRRLHPEGSGTPPSWDNNSGSWISLDFLEVSSLDDPACISYLGGAAVPYPAGETSPNGVEPQVFLDLPYELNLSSIPSNLVCIVPNSNYAYKYKEKFSWTSISFDEENYGEYVTRWNSSFVTALTQRLGLGMSPRNTTDGCAIDIGRETTLVVRGRLLNGSTKADRTVPYQSETPWGRDPLTGTVFNGGCSCLDGHYCNWRVGWNGVVLL
ncbi:uncharacterized protein BDW70DRAFT_163878 [Aspergillus foveolatus]|uniref:uncharacterized protein n=1 Tax=Aspergillus foveolatus TaxID=210207 RepID=UPI003CCE4D9E